MVKQTDNSTTSTTLTQRAAAKRAGTNTIIDRALKVYDAPGNEALSTTGIAISGLLLDLDLDTDTIVAALLYPAVKHDLIHRESVSEHFGTQIGKLLNDCMQMQSLGKLQDLSKYGTHQIENLRKMLLAMVTDVRAVLIIISERLIQLREAKSLPVAAQLALARESMDLYAPLANRIGIWQLKWEIEDLCLRYMEPDTYKEIAKWLSSRRVERVKYVNHALTLLNELLKKHQIQKFEITGRVKHIYSIYNKMRRKQVAIENIYDISAMRVLVPDVTACYAVLSALQQEFTHIPEEFDDYIAQPKANGYQSIHTVIYGPENRVIEVQIRTYDMHEISELGAASHWRYKEGMGQQAEYEAKIALLREIMAWQKEVATQTDTKRDEPAKDIFADRVYVFTPLGDIIDLPQGATPIDFAYHIHSEVGHRCRGAKVDGKMVSLTHALQTGNRVEILTSKEPNPSRDWLNPHLGYLHSERARSVLAHWFRVKDHVQDKKVASRGVTIAAAKTRIDPVVKPREDIAPLKASGKVTGIDSLLTKFAMCCKPLPGDNIVGYITQKSGVSIHRRDCKNIANLTRNEGNRFIEINWGKTAAGRYPVDLLCLAAESGHILRDVTGALANEEVQVAGIRTQVQSGTQLAIYVTIMITDAEELQKALRILQQVEQVHDVRRV